MSLPTIGMVGAGQLARMSYEAAVPLNLPLRVLAEAPTESAALISTAVSIGSPDDRGDLERFADECDVVTFDHELVDLDVLRALGSTGHVLRPTAETLSVATDKQRQRELLGGAGLPLPANRPVGSVEDAVAFGGEHGWPIVLKAVRGGYDGRGVWIVDDEGSAAEVVGDASSAGLRLFAEPLLDLERELAVIVARRPGGATVTYPVVETIQVEGICHEVLAPARVDDALAVEAEELGRTVAETVGSVGLLAIEMFVVDGQVLLNELAARPHNSGHLTIEGATTSQFENHLRAVADLPLGDTTLRAPATAMVNVIGTPGTGNPTDRLGDALAVPGAHVHLYDKQPRPGRKIGHVTVLGDDLDEVRRRARTAAETLAGGTRGGPGEMRVGGGS